MPWLERAARDWSKFFSWTMKSLEEEKCKSLAQLFDACCARLGAESAHVLTYKKLSCSGPVTTTRMGCNVFIGREKKWSLDPCVGFFITIEPLLLDPLLRDGFAGHFTHVVEVDSSYDHWIVVDLPVGENAAKAVSSYYAMMVKANIIVSLLNYRLGDRNDVYARATSFDDQLETYKNRLEYCEDFGKNLAKRLFLPNGKSIEEIWLKLDMAPPESLS